MQSIPKRTRHFLLVLTPLLVRILDALASFVGIHLAVIISYGESLFFLVLFQVLEERESLEEVISSRGRLGPEA